MTPNPLLSCDEDGDGDDDNKGGFFSFPQTPGREGRHGKWNTHCVLSSLMELGVASESLEPGGWPHSLPGTGRGFGAPPGEFGGNPGDRWREAVCSTTGPFSAPPSSVTRKMLGIGGRLAEPSTAAGPTGLPSWTGSESSGDGECGHRSQKQRRRGRHRLTPVLEEIMGRLEASHGPETADRQRHPDVSRPLVHDFLWAGHRACRRGCGCRGPEHVAKVLASLFISCLILGKVFNLFCASVPHP